MTPENIYTIALERLQTHGHLLHAHLLHIADFDEALMRDVSDRLVRAGLAVDNYGMKLLAVDPLGVSTGDLEFKSPVATTSQGRAGAPSDAPRIPSVSQDAARRNSSSMPKPAQTPSTGRTPAGLLRYMFWDAGRETGPFPREELEQRLAEGRLQPNEFIRIESDDEWIPAALALNPTDQPSAPLSKRKRPAQAPVEDVIAATKLAASIAEATKRTTPSKLNSKAAAEISPMSPNADWLMPYGGRGRLQTGAKIAVIFLGLWVYWSWPPAARTISTEFHQYVTQMDGMRDPESPAWKAFVARSKPRIHKLVDSLRPRANGANMVDRNLLWAGEKGLLPMLDEGIHGDARRNFTIHWTHAQVHLDGTASDNQTNVDPRAHAASPISVSAAESAIPPGTPPKAAHAPPGVRPATRPVPPGVKKPSR